jgi:NADPH:quinone reductase-like Zn-dependent oxidoreductase
VFDCVGAAVWDESLNSLKPGGRLVITGTTSGSQIPFNLSLMQGRPLTLMGSGARSRRSFAAMMHMVAYGGLRGVVGRTFDLGEAAKAHEVMAGRDFFGKLVLRVP